MALFDMNSLALGRPGGLFSGLISGLTNMLGAREKRIDREGERAFRLSLDASKDAGKEASAKPLNAVQLELIKLKNTNKLTGEVDQQGMTRDMIAGGWNPLNGAPLGPENPFMIPDTSPEGAADAAQVAAFRASQPPPLPPAVAEERRLLATNEGLDPNYGAPKPTMLQPPTAAPATVPAAAPAPAGLLQVPQAGQPALFQAPQQAPQISPEQATIRAQTLQSEIARAMNQINKVRGHYPDKDRDANAIQTAAIEAAKEAIAQGMDASASAQHVRNTIAQMRQMIQQSRGTTFGR